MSNLSSVTAADIVLVEDLTLDEARAPVAEMRGRQLALLLEQADQAPLTEAPAPPPPPSPPPPVWRAEDAPPDWPFVGLPPGVFKAIIADPPWTFRAYSDKGLKKSPQMHYACMNLDAIKALPVADLAHPDGCALALWATAPMLEQAIEVMRAWGFTYKTMGAWAKRSKTGEKWAFGTGHILRSAAEPWLIGTIGRPPVLARDERNLIVAPVREHSRKPDTLHSKMARLYGGPAAELFARETRAGWSAWGNEATRFDAIAAADVRKDQIMEVATR
jgi:N6-adenosine-specific RNA methylase IME4